MMVMDGKVVRTLIVLSLVGLIDAISYMAVAPSLIFYVQELGGTKEQYGLIMSAFSFCSFCLKPGTLSVLSCHVMSCSFPLLLVEWYL
jgi:phosphatidylserine synthase